MLIAFRRTLSAYLGKKNVSQILERSPSKLLKTTRKKTRHNEEIIQSYIISGNNFAFVINQTSIEKDFSSVDKEITY